MSRIVPRKHLGQHFLLDQNIARKIVASLTARENDPVVEIGPGTGALTGLLSERFSRVHVVEVDTRAAELIRQQFPNVTVHEADVLAFDWKAHAEVQGAALHVIGNLPYNITSQILFSLFEETEVIAEAVVMMQYEVAHRLVAEPSTKAYGILSVAMQLVARAEVLFPVSKHVFRPKPDVKSAVVRLTFLHETGVFADTDPKWVRRVVRTAFNQRRKTLRNSLRGICDEVGRTLPLEFADKRAEELTPRDFVHLAGYLQAGS